MTLYIDVEVLYPFIRMIGINHVVLIKIVLIQYLFGIPSIRQTIKEIQVNRAYRGFIGYSISRAIPHFSTFSKNYERKFKNTEVFNNIFLKILKIAEENNLIYAENVYIDAIHFKASANKKKFKKVDIKNYQDKLNEEINIYRLCYGKRIFAEKEQKETKIIIKSRTDAAVGILH